MKKGLAKRLNFVYNIGVNDKIRQNGEQYASRKEEEKMAMGRPIRRI
jgi:hypothetical protein